MEAEFPNSKQPRELAWRARVTRAQARLAGPVAAACIALSGHHSADGLGRSMLRLHAPGDVVNQRSHHASIGMQPKLDQSSKRSFIVSSATALRAVDSESAAEVWRAGPADVWSGPAQRVLLQLKHDPLLLLFDATVREELMALQHQRQRDERRAAERGAAGADRLALRKRVGEVLEKERMRIAAELLYLMICGGFKHLQVPLISSLTAGGEVNFGKGGEQLRGLTELYSLDALMLVRDHLFLVIGDQVTDPAAVHISLFQAGQVYAMSSLFGYYLRSADARYQLEKLVGSLGACLRHDADKTSTSETSRGVHRRPAPRWMEPRWAEGEAIATQSLKEYLAGFGPEAMQRITTAASAEAQVTTEVQVSALFGDLRVLKRRILEVVGEVSSREEAQKKLRLAIEQGRVKSISITGDDLRRVILEAVAFGALLYDSEREVGSVYELTPGNERHADTLAGG